MRATFLQGVVIHFVAIAMCAGWAIAPVAAQPGNNKRSEFPGRRIGGGTRGECGVNGQVPIVALTPANNLAVTSRDRPTLYFSMPTLRMPLPVELVLQDADGRVVRETSLTVNRAEKLVGVRIPEATLTVGQNYQWYLSAICDPADRSQNIVLSGWMRRVTPARPLTGTPGLELVKAYQEAGFTLDAIATLIELRQVFPDSNQLRQQWTQLLQALELDAAVKQSLVGQL